MKKFNTTFRNLMILVTIVAFGSCNKDFLDLKNPQTVGFDQVTDLKSLTTATTGVYSQFGAVNYYNRAFMVIPEIMGDNVFLSRRNGGRFVNHDNFTITNGDGYVTGAWTAMFRVIVNANLALSAAAKITFPDDQQLAARKITGELYATRALAYFDLVRFFSQPYNFTADASHPGVPIITEPYNEIISPPRATVKEVYDQIILDLTTAEQLIDAGKNDGHFTSVAAQALLAKVYLYKEDWAKAEEYATKVIASGAYSLLTNAAYAEGWNNKFTVESILEIANVAADNPGSEGIGYIYEEKAYGELLATKELYDIYSAGDVRKGLIKVGSRGAGAEEIAYFVKKYPRGGVSNDDNPKVLRLAEIYLIRAEARAEAGKTDPSKNVGALSDLNVVVKRAEPGAADVAVIGDALVQRIILERRKELAFEGNRLFDLNRKKMNVTNIQSDQSRVFTYPNNRFIMPIPFQEMNANDNMVQNPGWN